MTPVELIEARLILGELWGLSRPLFATELGRVLGFKGRNPGAMIQRYEAGNCAIPATVALAIRMMLAGQLPPGGVNARH